MSHEDRILDEIRRLHDRLDDLMAFVADQSAGVPRFNPKERAREIRDGIEARKVKRAHRQK